MKKLSQTLCWVFFLSLFSNLAMAICEKTDVPAKISQLECMVKTYHENPDRCAGGIGAEECELIRLRAFEAKMIDQAGRTYLEQGGYYPLPNLATGAVGAVCKCGCFDADTEIFSYEMGFGPVSELLAGDHVDQLTSEATLQNFALLSMPT